MSRLLAFLLVSLFLATGSVGLAKDPNGVYVLREAPFPGFTRIYEWDFREDGTVLYRSTLRADDGRLAPAVTTSVYYWRTPWFGKDVEILPTEDSDGIVAFIRDGDDLIGTGRLTEARERYRKQ